MNLAVAYYLAQDPSSADAHPRPPRRPGRPDRREKRERRRRLSALRRPSVAAATRKG
jgi:hypothetical protein